MKVASLQPLQPLPPPSPSPAAPSASPAPAAPRREPHGHEQPPHSDPSPALPLCLAESDVPLTPGATLTALAAQPIAHKPAAHRSASPIATVAGPAPGPVSGLIFNHKAPVQVPLDLEPIACKPAGSDAAQVQRLLELATLQCTRVLCHSLFAAGAAHQPARKRQRSRCQHWSQAGFWSWPAGHP